MDALADAIDDGKVTINNQQYTVNATLRTALTNYPDYYRAGSVGPDGFPDLVFGQSIIHPENTGLYLRRLYEKAWSAQTDARYNTQQRQQILAWTYGYMNHAAGDLWAHTLVNEFGQGVFPDVVDLTDPQKAAIAARHILVEGYIGDATPGFDGNPDRTTLPNGDVSDDSTPAISFNAPVEFIYDALVKTDDNFPEAPTAPATHPSRGKLIDFFLDLRAKLVTLQSYGKPGKGLAEARAALSTFNQASQMFADAEAKPFTCGAPWPIRNTWTASSTK